jgi:protein-glutamine gamma-glutamyltransferase
MTSGALSAKQIHWLVVGHWLVVLPHVQPLPAWIILLSGLAGCWRLAAVAGYTSVPSWPLRLLLAIGSVLGVATAFGTLIGLEPMVALLVVAAAMKLLECRQHRDAQVLVCLGFFIVATHLIYQQSLPMTVYGLMLLVVLLLSLVRLNIRTDDAIASRHLALVMLVTLFLIFPRIEPLWAVPVVGAGAVTGMDDRLSPGSVSRLARSDAVAFRVRFQSQPPPRQEWYWRGMVLNQFTQGAWTSTDWRDVPPAERRVESETSGNRPVRYELLLPATHQKWLFTLPYAQSDDARVVETAAQYLLSRRPIDATSRFEISTHPDAIRQPALSPWWREHELAWPANANPRSQARINTLREAFPEDPALINAVLDWFRTEPFYYTLSPTLILGDDFVDQFLFEEQRGFCEHYAYAFAVLMRQAGIPARVVGGYQGGELNPDTGTVVVRQLDAHAWAEIWLPNRGWVRVDPTAAVAPERIDYGVEEALANESLWLAEGGFTAYRFRHIPLVDWFRWQYDDLAWQWQRAVVGYDQREQIAALGGWFERLPGVNLSGLLGMVWFVILGALFLIGNPRPTRSPARAAEKAYLRLSKKIAKHGVERRIGESALCLSRRAAEVLGDDHHLVKKLSSIAETLYARPILDPH